jgi:arginine/serine-rich splicing factor 4/5/6
VLSSNTTFLNYSVGFQQGDGAIRSREDARRSSTKQRPTKTLFVVNFDPVDTRSRDLERHFEPYGKIVQVRIRKNFAFIQYETQEEATKALEATNLRLALESYAHMLV